MRILVTGGGGSIGRVLVPFLLDRGHSVSILDKETGAVQGLGKSGLRLVQGEVEEQTAVADAAAGAEAIIHLAWSFSDDPRVLLDVDLRGHLNLLEAARSQGCQHFVYTSSAVVYGKPLRVPIDEEHPLRVLEARKPAYGVAKEFAEKLTLLAGRQDGLPVTILRFWWAFGAEIGGRHLREMLRAAAAGQPVRVPADCGGSFLSAADLCRAIEALLCNPAAFGQVFNLASGYVTWEEVARMAIEVTGSAGRVEVIRPAEWTGAAFLADAWDLDDRRIGSRIGFAPAQDGIGLRTALQQAMARTWAQLQKECR
jgi:UDP-glucose 4-epimerase